MYLTLLNEKQKEFFLGLAYNISNIDGDFSNDEQDMIESYCKEMNIEYSDSIAKQKIDFLLSNITSIFDEKAIKIILFELIGLAMVDNNFDTSERNFLNKIISLYPIDEKIINNIEDYIKSYLDLQNKINNLILN